MIYEAAITEVQQILGWRSDKAAEIGLALQYAQQQREKPGATYPWFLKGFTTTPTIVGITQYLLPTNYIQDSEERDGNLYYFMGTPSASRPVFLKKRSYVDLLQKYLGVWPGNDDATSDVVPAGNPSEYTLDSVAFYIYPKPDRIINLIHVYWAKAATLSAGVENAWLREAPWVLIGEAALKIASDLQNADAVGRARTILDRANTDLFRGTIHRQEAGRVRSMGSRL